GHAIDFVVEADRAQLSEIVQRGRDGRLRTNIGAVATLDDAVATFNSTERRSGKTIIAVRPSQQLPIADASHDTPSSVSSLKPLMSALGGKRTPARSDHPASRQHESLVGLRLPQRAAQAVAHEEIIPQLWVDPDIRWLERRCRDGHIIIFDCSRQ